MTAPADASDLRGAVDAAANARGRLDRSPADVARVLADAARAWRAAPGLAPRLAAASGLGATMVADALDDVVVPFEATSMERLARRECAGAAPPPPVVAHVLASNVPALALPAIAHTLLGGTAVVVKSGRHDDVSAPAFREAIGAVDPELAATVLTVRWTRGTPDLDAALLAAAPVVVLTGADETVAALAPSARGRVLAFGTRTSVAIVDDDREASWDAVARDVAVYEQRGCLSPHVVFTAGDPAAAGAALAAALERLAVRWPPAPSPVEMRAGRRVVLDDAAFAGADVYAGPWGAVVVEPMGPARPTIGGRVVRVQPLGAVPALLHRLPTGTIECLGTTGPVPAETAAHGISRVCHVGAMQRPSLAWPRGGRPPIRMLLDPDATATMEDDR